MAEPSQLVGTVDPIRQDIARRINGLLWSIDGDGEPEDSQAGAGTSGAD